MIQIDPKYQSVLLESLEELMYQLSLQLEEYKGKPLDRGRKELTRKQRQVEKLQHLISTYDNG